MKSKISALIVVALGIGLAAFLFSEEPAQATNQQQIGIQELQERIGKLETQVTALQQRIQELESRKILTIPGSQLPQGSQVPPGSKQYKFNGQTYWFVPLH